MLRVFNVGASGAQVRATRLSQQPLTSLVLHRSAVGGVRRGLPLALSGCYDGCVWAYAPTAGVIKGNFSAHVDAVSCMDITPCGATLATASWDCSLKVWSLAEGRHPWDSTLPQPTAAITDLPGGVWAVALSEDGSTGIVGTEDGDVSLIDLRQGGSVAWQFHLGDDYVGGVAVLPDGRHVVSATADGMLALLDTRKSGSYAPLVATANCAAPLRCCMTDGAVALAGSESGELVLWDVGQQLGRSPAAGPAHAPGIDGLYSPLLPTPPSAVNALTWATLPRGPGGGDTLCMASGHEGGVLRVFWAAQ